jgi:hypothetical protein
MCPTTSKPEHNEAATSREWPLEECTFERQSSVDPVGRVFYRDGRVFRAIAPPHGDFVLGLVEQARRRDWSALGLVPTWRADGALPGYEAVIEHRRVPFLSLRGEWSGEGLRAAALCLLRLNAALLRDGLCLKDAHPWNILFDGARPWFIDWGSIRPSSELSWPFWYSQFRQYALAPLYAFTLGRHRIARAMLREHFVGVGNEVMEFPAVRRLPSVPGRIAENAGNRPLDRVLDELAAHVASMELPEVNGEWAAYPQPTFDGLSALHRLRLKDRIVHDVLAHDEGSSVLDIGTNNGLHAEIAAAHGKRVIACDVEESCLNRLFLRVEGTGADVLPLYHDFLWPIGDSGLLNAIPSSVDRLRCDTVLAMALTHHLALRQGVSLEAIARGIHGLARRRAVVEFVPFEDEHVTRWSLERPPGYSVEGFIAAMRPYFESFAVVPSEPAPRVVIVFDGARPPDGRGPYGS